ncbi:glycosyltransferase 87 family protein, partial [Bacteroidota bacterium]
MTFRVLLLLCFGVISLTAPVKPLWPVLVSASILASIIVALVWLREKPTVRDVLFLAILARLILFPLAPSLSDDGFRYVWDGMLQWEGINPFLHRPIDAAVEPFSGLALFSHLNSSEYFTVYPPLSQIFFVLGGWFPAESWFRSFLAIKLLVVGAEIGALYLLGQMVSARSLLLYAWNPLVVVETAGQAHTETLMVALLISTVWAYRNNRPKLSTVALSAAMWVKLYPVLFIPFLLRRVGWKFIWIPILVSGLLAGPYYAPGVITNCVESLKLYVGLFEFYSGPYLSLKWLAYRLGGHTGLEFVVGVSLAASYLAFIIWLYWTDGRKTWSLSQTLFLALAGLLVASTTIHPWYFLG